MRRTDGGVRWTHPPDDSSPTDCFKGSRQAEDPPVPLPQLDHLAAHVLQANAVPPLRERQSQTLFIQSNDTTARSRGLVRQTAPLKKKKRDSPSKHESSEPPENKRFGSLVHRNHKHLAL